ncbi:E2.7.4.8 [Acanthosepion pharaonis]|uniref:guanylate kinase n=1 Tax=Acanthosepion pharaonis TaxID=158019 RepID=A0A812D9A0_ACAPH|nr:E2.7.4.8 [Sepia pharaonis]
MRRLNLLKNVYFVHISYRLSVGFTHFQKMTNVKPVVISGPSGVGKSTLLEQLMKEFPNSFAFSVSHTTRKPRKGEENGKHYHFVSHEAFQDLVSKNGFLEYTEFSGNCYGTSKRAVESIQETGRICILDVEINGVKSIKKSNLNARYIFVRPPSLDELAKRLHARGTESEESLKKRLDTADEAISYSEKPGVYDHIIINDNLTEAYNKLKDILMEDIKKLH